MLLNGRRVDSCLTLAVMHDGGEITAIEGLAQGEVLHPMQAAFLEHDGFQRGGKTGARIANHARQVDLVVTPADYDSRWSEGSCSRRGVSAAVFDRAISV